MYKLTPISVFVFTLGLGACVATPFDVSGSGAAMELRSVQTREYHTLDKPMSMRAVIATLQDLGFTIDQADVSLGIITGTRMGPVDMRITVTVLQKSDAQVSVRANARVGQNSIRSAETYQDFFAALDRAMFLARNDVN